MPTLYSALRVRRRLARWFSQFSHPPGVLPIILLAVAVVSLPQMCFAQRGRGGQGRDVWGAAPVPSPEAQAKQSALIDNLLLPELTLDVDPRRSVVLRTKRPVTRASVTDPEILEIVQFSPTEFELIGGRTGQTSLTLWFGDPEMGGEILRYFVRVSPDQAVEDRRRIEYSELERKLNELFPNSMIQLIPIADKLIVRGQARDAEEATRILGILRGQGGGSGRATDISNQGRATEPFPGTDQLPDADIVSLLHVPHEQQVLLKVRIAELSRTAMRNMSSQFRVDTGDFLFNSNLTSGGAVRAVLNTDEVRLVIEALASNSYGKVLAEPNLVTLSGTTANFIAGGEFAVPTIVGVEGAASVATSFRGFGTQVSFTPTVLDKDRIRLHVTPSFSEINDELTVENGDFAIPGLNSRAVSTTVDLRKGQWLALAGLIQDQQGGTKTRVPLLGDIPVLDTVFSRKEVRREETELIILVSPELVHPLEPYDAPAVLPGMEVTEPHNWAFYLRGRYEGDPGCDFRSTVAPLRQQLNRDGRRSAKRQSNYCDLEDYYIQGKHGFMQ